MSYTSGKALEYCGKAGWKYIGQDPDTNKPVLKNDITKTFIIADESKITQPIDYEQELLCDIERILDTLVDKGRPVVGADAMRVLADGLSSMGYTDGNPNSVYTILGILCNTESMINQVGGHISLTRINLEYIAASDLFAANIRKNKIVVAS